MRPFRLLRVVLLGLLVSCGAFLIRDANAGEAKIYVIREADGSMRFTNKPPRVGEDAEVFTASGARGAFFRAPSQPRTNGSRSPNQERASLRLSSVSSSRRAASFSRISSASESSYGTYRRGSSKIYPDLYSKVINDAARRHRVDPALVKAVIHAESAFNPRAVSPKGALGLMQLMPGTARMLGVRNAFHPVSNIHGGTRYLAHLLRRFRNESHAIAAYNAGPVPVDRYNGVPPYSETREYVRRVLTLKKQYRTARG